MTKFLTLWLPVLLWYALIFGLSSIPHLEITHEPVGNFLTRKAAHLAEYAILALLLLRAQNYRQPRRAVLFSTVLGITDEIHQAFVPSRTPLLTDVIFDLGGSILGVTAWKYLPILREKLPR